MEQLEQCIIFLTYLQTNISFCASPVYELILSCNINSSFIKVCKQRLKQGEDFPNAWKKAIDNADFDNEEKELLLNFGENFGALDIEGQLSQTKYCKERLGMILDFARQEKTQKYKLYIIFGISAGLTAVVFAI